MNYMRELELGLLDRMLLDKPYIGKNLYFIKLRKYLENDGLVPCLTKLLSEWEFIQNIQKNRGYFERTNLNESFGDVLSRLMIVINNHCVHNKINRKKVRKSYGLKKLPILYENKIKWIDFYLRVIERNNIYLELNESLVVNEIPSSQSKRKTNKI